MEFGEREGERERGGENTRFPAFFFLFLRGRAAPFLRKGEEGRLDRTLRSLSLPAIELDAVVGTDGSSQENAMGASGGARKAQRAQRAPRGRWKECVVETGSENAYRRKEVRGAPSPPPISTFKLSGCEPLMQLETISTHRAARRRTRRPRRRREWAPGEGPTRSKSCFWDGRAASATIGTGRRQREGRRC